MDDPTHEPPPDLPDAETASDAALPDPVGQPGHDAEDAPLPDPDTPIDDPDLAAALRSASPDPDASSGERETGPGART